MSRLFLLRHAKAAWAQPGMRDFDRPLEPAGRTDAEALGGAMASRGYRPELVLCSTAIRASETWQGVATRLDGATEVTYEDGLYSADATGYLALIRNASETTSLLVVGHNPMMEDLAVGLTNGGANAAPMPAGFPTCGLAVIDFRGSFAEAGLGRGALQDFLTPAAR